MSQPPEPTEPTDTLNPFFERPILNSPYTRPTRHWELDAQGQPTQRIIESRRSADFVTPIPRPSKKGASKKGKASEAKQLAMAIGDGELTSKKQTYDAAAMLNEVRRHVEAWRLEKNPDRWDVTPETARLLQHWRHFPFAEVRPFFCQLEAVEVVIWLTEVLPARHARNKSLNIYADYLKRVNDEANPGLNRLALKLATGAGKTTVMAMLIAWQTLNAVRRTTTGSSRFTRGFLIVAPGLTIKDRLRVLLPSDPDSYYKKRQLVPDDMLNDLGKAKIVITNFHAFKRRERAELSKGGRALLQGRGPALDTLETDGQMIQRVMPDLMGIKNILVLNDEAHHCYREKPIPEEDLADLDTDGKKQAEENNKAARVWISGLEIVKKTLGLSRIIDLSATPFFLSGSGYAEGTLFPWTMSDFSLMDAIECGIVKLPRVPVADNIPDAEIPMYRDLWQHIGKKMPKKGRGEHQLDPHAIPPQLQTALDALYGHYEKVFVEWQKAGHKVPPCFIVVCNNTATSKLVYDYISGFVRKKADGAEEVVPGRLALFSNFDTHGNALARPNTILIDSQQLESGDALDDNFRAMAEDEIDRFRRELVERSGDPMAGQALTDQQLLREVMNTVGKENTLGADIRCVVSVSMLTEGWDANNVTHVLGVRAFGTQLLCEQVIGRALRRQSYELNADGLFDVEYADVLGIPFDFTAKPVPAPPKPPPKTTHIRALAERQHLAITFPRVVGYGVELPEDRIAAKFTADSTLELTPALIGATETVNSGIIGQRADLNLVHTKDVRPSSVLFELTAHLVQTHWKSADGSPNLNLFGQLKRVAKTWLDQHLVCKGGTYPAQLRYKTLADLACERIVAGIVREHQGDRPVTVTLDPYNPEGSSAHVSLRTSREELWTTDASRCHVNYVIYDSNWEAELCRVVEKHPRVVAYVKNHGLGFEVPYVMQAEKRLYRPDFIVLVDDGHGPDDLLRLVIEIKGFRGEDAKTKRETMETQWVPGVNHAKRFGRWDFAELTSVYEIESEFAAKVEAKFGALLDERVASRQREPRHAH